MAFEKDCDMLFSQPLGVHISTLSARLIPVITKTFRTPHDSDWHVRSPFEIHGDTVQGESQIRISQISFFCCHKRYGVCVDKDIQ